MRPVSSESATKHEKAPIHPLTEKANRGELIAVIGTGVSLGLTNNAIPALSWRGLIQDGFQYGVRKGTITTDQSRLWKGQLDSTDLDDLLGAAEFVSRKLEGPHGDLYGRWLESVFKSLEPTNTQLAAAIQVLHRSKIPIITLNYDQLIESVTGLQSITLNEKPKLMAWMRREAEGVLHLHGIWDTPATCILGIRDYQTTLSSEVRDLIQRSLGSLRQLVFIGCGETFADPNFSALIKWLRNNLGASAPQHFALVTKAEEAERNSDLSWRGFVEPLSYGTTRDELPAFLMRHFQPGQRSPKGAKNSRSKGTTPNSKHATLLCDYRSFLLKDCGEMTIEGMRADMATAQRRFELERLFVPTTALPLPPDFPDTDQDRDQKLLRWRKNNSVPLPFSEVFAENSCLALLALPGGGKTLLLKRLAVAYADSTRRKASIDALPDADLMPVLIRCREWREHIHLPISTLLKKIHEITGQSNLEGLDAALLPLLKQGQVLLLVDGLDEVHSDALRSTFVDNLESFFLDYKQIKLVVTSREAGFNLVAPSLSRFCKRWKIAPLNPKAITALCSHWHRLMNGDSSEAKQEAQSVTSQILGNPSLQRLAENPLLLTMLLVVKQGAGRLPPDRVSLYSRAVEVLLDTWNIKGHDSLSPKEAVPQLAYVAFQLMRAGKQTATEGELLGLLEEAREKVPQIRRYAKDTPHEFLKRVELRSSLLVEGGSQRESGKIVPFYQFRHLTFQEYLAAVAAAEGHYIDYNKADTVLTPLENYITSDEWKEVIPMSAVLARKQAEPLISALVFHASELRRQIEHANGNEFVNQRPSRSMPRPVSRLVQCLVEEAEAAPETLSGSLQLIAFFARGCYSDDDWLALIRGPYGEELLHQAWLLFKSRKWPYQNIYTTCARFAAGRRNRQDWLSSQGKTELGNLLNSHDMEAVGRGLFTCCGLLLEREERVDLSFFSPLIEVNIFRNESELRGPAIWAWVLTSRHRKSSPNTSEALMDRFLAIWLTDAKVEPEGFAAFALWNQAGMARDSWTPILTKSQQQEIRQIAEQHYQTDSLIRYDLGAAFVVAFHSKTVWTDDELTALLIKNSSFLGSGSSNRELDPIHDMLKAMNRLPAKRAKRPAPDSRKS